MICYKLLNVCLDVMFFLEGIEVMNIIYSYLDVWWRDICLKFFFYGCFWGYFVILKNMDDFSEEKILVFISCYLEGINIINFKENMMYCVYIVVFI